MNVELRRLQENIVCAVNSANLPTEAKRLVVFEVLMKLEAQVNKEIDMELQAQAEAQKEKESE